MDLKSINRTYIQCRSCGNIYQVNYKISIDKTIVPLVCPRCGHNRGLNCGYSDLDIMELKDVCLDERYFIYNSTVQNEWEGNDECYNTVEQN